MGKRKQKTRWCSLDISVDVDADGLQWGQAEHQASSFPEGSASVAGSAVPGSGGGTRRSSLAPRFERKAAAEAEKKQFYYEGEFCEAEDLPNGFTKIRSKNLDILFKHDYYEQRLAAHLILAEKVKSSDHSISAAVLEVEEKKGEEEKGDKKPPTSEIMDHMTEPDTAVKPSSWSFDHIDPNDIEEFKPMNSGLVSLSCEIDSAHTSPFYGSYPPHPQYPDSLGHEASPHPHLYLYSPSDNSLIPCEEIIIPNPVMSPEGPVYSGPTNIYLAYPVQGPDGKGYITQPFATPGSAGSYLSQDSASYSPSISYDGSNYYSSTQQDSGSSSQPTSPPPLATYHPTSWINQDQPSLGPHERHNSEGCYDPQPMDRSAEKYSPTRSTTTTGSTASSTTATYIPGLSLDSKRISPKKSQKKRKKKKVTSSLEQRRSSTSESENLKMEEVTRHDNSESIHDKIDSEQVTGILVPEVSAEPIQEVYLTDDLADSLVNPPTEPEISDEEISQESISLLSTYSSVEVSENKFGVARTINENKAENGFKMAEDESNRINSEVVPEMKSIEATVQSEVPWMVETVLMENFNADSITGDIEHTEEKKETLEGEFNANTKCGGLFDVPVKKVEDRTEAGNKVFKAVPGIKKSQKKTRTRNQKVELDSVVKSESKSLVLKSEDQSNTTQAMKKSYSSVMKCNLAKESNNNPTISCKPDMETVTRCLLPHSSDCSASQDNTEKDSDTWEKVPLNSFKPEIKGKPSKKRRKHTRTIIEDSLLLEELPESEIVPQFANCTNTLEETNRKRQEADREVDLCDDIEVEKRKLRKKKKFETKNTSHRVIICDDQISLRYSTAARRASEVLPTSILDTVKTSGYCDFLVIREFGSGIFRGCMDLGRLYQGKYIPPERTDGLPAWCEEESVIEKGIAEEVIGEESSSTASADIDLD